MTVPFNGVGLCLSLKSWRLYITEEHVRIFILFSLKPHSLTYIPLLFDNVTNDGHLTKSDFLYCTNSNLYCQAGIDG